MSDHKIDLEMKDGDGEWTIYVKRHAFICGTPWVARFNIPVIPVNVDGYERWSIGTASCASNDSVNPIP